MTIDAEQPLSGSGVDGAIISLVSNKHITSVEWIMGLHRWPVHYSATFLPPPATATWSTNLWIECIEL